MSWRMETTPGFSVLCARAKHLAAIVDKIGPALLPRLFFF